MNSDSEVANDTSQSTKVEGSQPAAKRVRIQNPPAEEPDILLEDEGDHFDESLLE